MKRIFASIGFSFAATLLVVNLISVEYIPIITAGLAVLLIASLALSLFRKALVTPICLGCAMLACLLFLTMYNGLVAPQLELDYKTVNTSLYIVDIDGQNDDGDYVYTVKTTSIEQNNAPQEIKLRLKSSNELDAEPYEIINAKITAYSLGDNAIDSFGYWSENIFLSANILSYSKTNTYIHSPWKYTLLARQDIINTLYSHIGGDEGALSVALLTGYKNLLSDEAYANFTLAGATHLMAISGLHLTVITGILFFIIKKLKINNKLGVSISLLTILAYIGIAGFSKSVIRAGIMLSVMLVGKPFKRRSDSLNSLGFAVFIICLNPFAVYDVGAMLSVLSVLSLITLYPHLVKLSKRIGKFKVWKAFLVALSILIYTMPVIYIYYGNINLISLVSNIILVPLGSVAVVISLFAYLLLKAKIPYSFVPARLINKLLLALIKIFASVKHTSVDFGDDFGFVIAGVLLIFAFCFIINNKRFMKVAAIISIVMVCASPIINTTYNSNKAHIYQCSSGGTVITYKSKTVVYGLDNKSDYYSIKNYLQSNRLDIDTLILSDGSYEYAEKLLNTTDCENIVSFAFNSDFILNSSCDNITITNNYKDIINDDFEIEYKIDENGKYFTSKIIDTTLFISDDFTANCDIIEANDTINDNCGSIDLSKGNVYYTIAKNNSYSARRVD